MKQITIKENEAGQRFDKLLLKLLKNVPMSFIYKMLRKKNITLNGKKADGSEKLMKGDEVRLFFSDESFEKFAGGNETEPTGCFLKKDEIIFEDENIIIVNKPIGELSQKAEASDVSINERILAYLSDNRQKNEAFTPGVCNRLDRNTSGLIIAGKTLKGLQDISEMLKEHTLKKYYFCICVGTLNKEVSGVAYIKKNEKTNKVSVSEEKKEDSEKIEATYRPVVSTTHFSLVAVNLKTGKPHQIRAHLASLGHPLLGDVKYGYKPVGGITAKHQMLHAFMLVFPKNTLRLNGLENKVISCMPPKDFLKTAKEIFGDKEVTDAILEFERLKRLGT